LEAFDPNLYLIIIGILVALSYIFDILSKKLKIPSVLFLLATGISLQLLYTHYNSVHISIERYLPLLGTIGLIMIVLEAAVDLGLSKSKIPMIRQSILLAIMVLLISSFAITGIIMYFTNEVFFNSLVYAIPLSVVSSAVLIPSVHTLTQNKKEFLIYESSFSDIIGIMFFNFIVLQEADIASFDGIWMILNTIAYSIVISYLLVYFFSKIKTEIKIFLMISILAILYSLGKQLHFSSLLMIFIFGIVLNNSNLFFFGRLKKLISPFAIKSIIKDFRIITSETAFIVRTFFFIAFGMSIDLESLIDLKVVGIGSAIVSVLYLVRYMNFKTFLKTDVYPEIFLAPRGLITILLFYSIPMENQLKELGIEVLFFVVLATGLIMMLALLFTKEAKDIGKFTIVDFGLGPSSDHANLEEIGTFGEFDDLMESKDEKIDKEVQKHFKKQYKKPNK